MRRGVGSGGRCAGPAALSLAPALMLASPGAAQTAPGTAIRNVATLAYDGGTAASNGVTLTVAERLDVALVRSPDRDRPGRMAFTLVNRGSGTEAFAVSASLAGDGATLGAARVVAPSGEETPLADGRTPALAAGAGAVLLVPVEGTAGGGGDALTVGVRAATGSGDPGTAFAGAGDGGGDAVVGPTGAAASLTVALAGQGAADAAPVLEKSQAVAAPDGSATPVAGARVTYTLVARFAAAAGDAVIADPIPAGTAYLAGSLVLDGAPLPDAGHLAAGAVTVPLGAVAAGAVRTLRFTVIIS